MTEAPQSEQDCAAQRRTTADEQARRIAEQTVYAVERTYAGWLRLGLGAVALAIGTHAVLRGGSGGLAEKITASLFLGVALMIFVFAHGHALRLVGMINESRNHPRKIRFTRLTYLFVFATLAVGALIWIA